MPDRRPRRDYDLAALNIAGTTLHEAGPSDLQILLDRLGVDVAAVDADQAQAALSAWRRFGKGRHPAGLNLGDCFAHALARVTAAALLFKGDDFRQTDVVSAV